MSDIISAINDDIDFYIELCELYNEKIQYDYAGPNCYGEHADKLIARNRKEQEDNRKKRKK